MGCKALFPSRSMRDLALFAVSIVFILNSQKQAHGQAAQIDIGGPPGAFKGRGKLGPAVGAASESDFSLNLGSQAPLSGLAGPGGSHVPSANLNPPSVPMFQPPTRFTQAVTPPSMPVPAYGAVEVAASPERIVGPPQGMTLDQAIELFMKRNLAILALEYEIPMAQADVVTAGLRANPVFYADEQLIPYGNYSYIRPGGPAQVDININYPVDISHKRKYRKRTYESAKKVTEAQLQDSVRNQIDNLYTVYIDVVDAMQNLKYSQIYMAGVTRVLEKTQARYDQGQIKLPEVEAVLVNKQQAEIDVRERVQFLQAKLRTLAFYLNLDPPDADRLQVRTIFFDPRPLPGTQESLTRTALDFRPDMTVQRFALDRAQNDVRLSMAERYSDVYVLYQPYTFQNNNWLGLKSAYSWTIGATVPMPIYNRNQGNIARAKLNVDQTRLEVSGQEKQVAWEVDAAIREFEVSRVNMIDLNERVIKTARRVRDGAYTRWDTGATSVLEYLDAQKDFNDIAKRLSDAVTRHRRAMLDLNTAVGVRLLP